jgi:predicted dehydrogenase
MKIACIGAGCSGAGQMILFEKYLPGSVVAFCDLSREIFDNIVDEYQQAKNGGEAGDFKTDIEYLRPDFKDIPFYTDADEMLQKEDIDAVIIATHCSSHSEMVEKCVKYNKHILLEKPIAINEEDVDNIWRLLKDYPKVATVNFTMRGAPVSLAAKRHVQSGDIGKIVSVQYINNVHYGDGYFRKWMRTKEKIGSLLLQKATHDLDIINSIIGLKPLKIAAFGSRLVYGGDMPDELYCDDCDKKWSCPMSSYKLKQDANKYFPPKRERKCVYAREIDIDDNHTIIISYEGGVTTSYSQTFNVPHGAAQRGGNFIGTDGVMKLEYYGDYVDGPIGKSHIDVFQYHQKPDSYIHEVYDWGGVSHFDGSEYVMLGKIAQIEGCKTEIKNTIYEGYVSAKMCLAAQKSIQENKIINLQLD